MKRKPAIFLLVGLIVLLGLLIFVFILGKDRTILEDNQLIVNEFEYTYDGMVSNICPGLIESFNFSYGNQLIVVTAQKKTFREDLGRNFSDYSYCINKGGLIHFYDALTGLPRGLPKNCIVKEQLPPSFDKPEFLTAKCDRQIRFNILNSDRVNSCISGDGCELIHGVDVELTYRAL